MCPRRPGWSARRRRGGVLLPRPAAGDLYLQGEAQEGADEDDGAEHGHAGEGGLGGDGADDVGGHQQFQAEQDGLAELLAEAAVIVGLVPAEPDRGRADRDDAAQDDDGHPGGVDDLPDPLDHVVEVHAAPSAGLTGCWCLGHQQTRPRSGGDHPPRMMLAPPPRHAAGVTEDPAALRDRQGSRPRRYASSCGLAGPRGFHGLSLRPPARATAEPRDRALSASAGAGAIPARLPCPTAGFSRLAAETDPPSGLRPASDPGSTGPPRCEDPCRKADDGKAPRTARSGLLQDMYWPIRFGRALA